MIMCGDIRELPPVRASEVYRRSKSRQSIFSAEVTWDNLAYFPLLQVVRKKQATFSPTLTKIGD